MRTVAASLVFFFLSTVVAYSNDFTVNVMTDGNSPNQLRGAIAAAVAAGAGPHTINIAEGTYDVTLGQISFGSSPISISFVGAGAGSTIISMTSAAGQNRIFFINPSGTVANVNVSITGITFTGGHLRSDNFGGGAILGGGPANALTITNCIFSANTVDNSVGTNGGAVAMEGGGTLSINQCTFANNTTPKGNGGALYYFLPASQSGNLSVTNSVFTDNNITDASSAGGAIAIDVLAPVGATTSDINIQKNNFLANHANASGGDGGAIHINNRFPGTTAFINFNRFANNTSTNSQTTGIEIVSANGNVDINNNWWGCNDGPVSGSGCNKAAVTGSGGTGSLIASNWLQLSTATSSSSVCSGATGNATTVTAGFLINSSGSAVAASDLTALAGLPVSFAASFGSISNTQTTIQPNGTATAMFTSNGTVTLATVNSTVDNVLVSDLPARATITVKASPVINTQPSSHGVCSGSEVMFTVAASGASLSYNWFRNTTALTDGPTASGATISGTATSALTISNPGTAESATSYNVQITSNGCTTTSGFTQLQVAPLVLLNTDGLGNNVITVTDNAINDASCNRIAVVQPSGAAAVSGQVNAAVTIETGQPAFNGQPYVKRHYDIAPTTNANAATATITLYFLQAEFDSYNAAMPGTNNDLPTGPSDAAGRANLRVTQYHGVGSTPGTYSGWGGTGPATVLITPGGGNVNWNNTNGWWEVTFPVTGFSGFYVTGLIANALPVTLTQLTAVKEQDGVRVQWHISREVGFSHYGVETSPDGRNYTSIGTVEATNNTRYSFLHNNPVSGVNYYRLKLSDIDGNFTYSPVVSCVFNLDGYFVRVMNNPFRQHLDIRIDAKENTKMQLQLTDQSGKLLLQKSVSLNKGSNTVTLPTANIAAKGMYLLHIQGGGFGKTLKVVKGE